MAQEKTSTFAGSLPDAGAGELREQRQARAWERRAHERPPAHSATRRAILIGMILVALVAAFTPYNDYILRNSPFIGNHFPIGIVMLMVLLMLVVNPLLLFFKRRAFSTGELVVIMTLNLVAAAVPSSGLIRYFEPMVLAPYWQLRQFSWWKEITDLMPHWLTPTTDSYSPIISNYWLGIDPLRGGHVPWAAFILPALLWGILIAALLGAALFLAAIFRRQWVHHERLSFPLATIPLELMAAPDAGKWYNALWRNPVLWTGVAIPVLVYLLAGLHGIFPGVPFINMQYDVRDAFTERPWDALPAHLTQAQVYFAVVGVCFFVPSEVAFSLWLFVVANGAMLVIFSRSNFHPGQQENTRAMGIYVAYFFGLLWLARGHLKTVMIAAWRNSPRAEDEPLSYRAMFIGWVGCMVVAWVWLMVVGMSPAMAAILLFAGTMLVTLMARIVAETGLFFVGPVFWPNQIFSSLLGKGLVGVKSFFWTETISRIFYADLRETLMPFAANSLRMASEIKTPPADSESGAAAPARQPDSAGGSERVRWFRWLFAALLLSLLVSGAVTHYLSYTNGRSGMDHWASEIVPREGLRETYQFAHSPPETPLSTSWGHFVAGGVMAVVLMVGRVMWAGWPLHPIGLVLMDSGPMKIMWFSIFLGWAAKKLLLKYGGAAVFRRARPFFIGLILGEIMSAGGWMIVGLLSHGAIRYTLLPQ